MKLLPSDPDIATIVNRINAGDIDLQPDFQRGEVWSKAKKQRLIDSILRDWHVPPVHVIENSETRKQEVLDGQQRLAAIRDFVQDRFSIDGSIEPLENQIAALDGSFFSGLPDHWKRQFNQFTIRVFRIVEYKPTEPAELFFRLNQPASLTGAEQRNAFFGPVREQIKRLSASLDARDVDGFLAFSNSRMAYDDVLARSALAVQRGTLAEKITSEDLAALYRSSEPLSLETFQVLERAIEILTTGFSRGQTPLPKFNKATLFSWLLFLVRSMLAKDLRLWPSDVGEFLTFFEKTRNISAHDPIMNSRRLVGSIPVARLFAIYEVRSSARVADVSSVLLRDAIIWLTFENFSVSQLKTGRRSELAGLSRLHKAFQDYRATEEDVLARCLLEYNWGTLA
jgi:Protein of unknown function DUF262